MDEDDVDPFLEWEGGCRIVRCINKGLDDERFPRGRGVVGKLSCGEETKAAYDA